MRPCAILLSILFVLCGETRAQQKSPPAQPGETKTPSSPTAAPLPNVAPPAVPLRPHGKLHKSRVRITATEVEPDYKAPWNSGGIQRGVGAGFVIEGSRIMTNAHVVSNSRYLTVEHDGDPNKDPASVVFVSHDCVVAMIKVSSPEFFKDMVPLSFGGRPELESTVSA